jgi:flagellar protein FliS
MPQQEDNMYKNNPYKHTSVTTASPGELIVMLYDGALKFTGYAEQAYGDGDAALAASSIARAVAIINYLQSVLDEGQSPELVGQLDRLYMKWTHGLTKANLQRDPAKVIEIRAEIAEMREAWVEVNRQVATGEA